MEMEFEEEGTATEGRGPWIAGIVIVLVFLGVAGIVGFPRLTAYFVDRYYTQSYLPLSLSADQPTGDTPAEHHIAGVPWISTSQTLSASNSLQMVAAYYQLDQDRPLFDFLAGFTYGGGGFSDPAAFSTGGTEAVPGFIAAAPFFNRTAQFWTSNDSTVYLQALRNALAEEKPVIVPLDFDTLYDLDDQHPAHSIVLVGYTADGFEYYETVCTEDSDCAPGRQSAGAAGLTVDNETFLNAVLTQATNAGYPWQYGFTVFAEGTPAQDLVTIWQRNGANTLGDTRFGPKQGAKAVQALASQIETGWEEMDVTALRQNLELVAAVRADNADFLRTFFGDEMDLAEAAILFDQASQDYQHIVDTTPDGIVDQAAADVVAGWLRDAAGAETKAGEILFDQGG